LKRGISGNFNVDQVLPSWFNKVLLTLARLSYTKNSLFAFVSNQNFFSFNVFAENLVFIQIKNPAGF
jgi:hypothetical protein